MSGPAAPRLLLDQNLAASLVRRLADLYPGSAHMREMDLASADDEAIWSLAATGGYVIVTKDDDFRQRSLLRGAPPHVVWVRLGNCQTAEVEALLRGRVSDVRALVADPDAALLILTHLP